MIDHFKKFFVIVILFNLLAFIIVLALEYYMNLGVCELCLYQRYIFIAIIVISAIAMFMKIIRNFIGVLIVLLYLTNSGIALTQVLMEEGFVSPSDACTGLIPSGVSDLEAFKAKILSNSYTPCNTAEFRFIGISLAGYSFISSTAMFLFSLIFVGVFILFRYKSEEERLAQHVK